MTEWGNDLDFSREDVEAGWRGLEGNAPRGRECPFTAELLDLALGLSPPEREGGLRQHVGECPRCGQRFRFQRRALLGEPARVRVAVGTAAHPSNAWPEQTPSRWSGEVSLLAEHAADDGGPVWIKQVARLGIAGGEGEHTVRVILSWRKKPHPRREGKSTIWKLALHVPPEADPEHGNRREDLEMLNGCEVMLVLRTSEDKRLPLHATRLEWDPTHQEIVSHPEEVPDMRDPHTVTRIDLYREKTLDAYET
jgi:hypothetical protein